MLVFGALILASNEQAQAGEYSESKIVRPVQRCVEYGFGLIELGHGNCERAHVRVAGGIRSANSATWTSPGTSSTALRSDGAGMVPGVAASGHLRVRNGLESYSPF